MTANLVTEDHWSTIKAELRRVYPKDTFESWFAPVESTCDDNCVTLLAPNDFAAIWIEENYLDMIREKLAVIAGPSVKLAIATKAVVDKPAREPAEPLLENRRVGVSRRLRPGADAQTPSLPINPKNTFDNFIVGPSNQLAHAASIAVAQAPGRAYNPLFLYGDTGLGKTHLMHSVAHSITRTNPGARVVYVSCETFTNEFLQAVRENTLDQFRKFYRSVDVLLIDDIQFLEGKERTQDEFFHTFNNLFDSQKQLCLSSDRPASEISKLEARLVSRFQWGMVTDIQAPDLETRTAILSKKAAAMDYRLSPEILQFLAKRITRNVRRMEGALLKVGTYAQISKKPLDLATVEQLIKDILQEEARNQVTIEKIQNKVVEYYDLRLTDMISKRRPNNIAFPRQVAMYLCRLLTNQPLKEIGEAFGGRDHGTVIYACKSVENAMEQDERVKHAVEYLNRQISQNA
ncbi:MAG: chromosomal replication initiator protein DnaA [Opitutales bacterium]|nr:chromosomal replication initiator protein DnaA [Opitutales bacterium]